jgi:hypothetical protein
LDWCKRDIFILGGQGMSEEIEAKISLTLIPPGLYDSNDSEWQEICKNIYEELNNSLSTRDLDIKLQPEKVNHPKGVEFIDIFDKLLITLGGTAALGATLKYLLDKLIDLRKHRIENERPKKIRIHIDVDTYDFEGVNPKEAGKLVQKIEKRIESKG